MQFLKRLQDVAEELDTKDPNIKRPLDALLQAIQDKQVNQDNPDITGNQPATDDSVNANEPDNAATPVVPAKPVKALSRGQQETIASTVAKIAQQSGVEPSILKKQLDAAKQVKPGTGGY